MKQVRGTSTPSVTGSIGTRSPPGLSATETDERHLQLRPGLWSKKTLYGHPDLCGAYVTFRNRVGHPPGHTGRRTGSGPEPGDLGLDGGNAAEVNADGVTALASRDTNSSESDDFTISSSA